jgi:ABC-type Fe2+-enterobactin transport system substrate-binding protein
LILPPFNNQGRYDGVSLANDVTLQDDSEYSITFNARDPARNVSNPVSVNSILYDITAPFIKTTAPVDEFTPS